MGELLKRIRECISGVWNWNGFSLNLLYNVDNTSLTHACSSDQTNAIERLPLDVLIQILKLLERKDAARLTSVCKLWTVILSDDKVWNSFLHKQQDHGPSTFFAETYLRYGLPVRICPRLELSYMDMYGERAKVPRAIIIDGGAGYYKFGWSNYDSPSVRLETSVEFANTGAPVEATIRHIFETIYNRMHVYADTQPVIISTPITYYGDTWHKHYGNVLGPVLFKMGVPAYCIVNQATLAMFSARRRSGILVNIGYRRTEVFAILNGKIRYTVRVERVGVGGLSLTKYLKEQLRQRNIHVSSLSTVRLLKEKLCYVALDYEAELLKDTESSCRVDSSGWYTLKQERFRTGELLFQPQIGGINVRGLHQAVAECINHCSEIKMKSGHDWFKTVVLAGGTARLPGLAERLKKELDDHDLLPTSVSKGIRVIASPYGTDAAWHGAKVVSNLSTFTNKWCIKRPPKSKSKLESTPVSTTTFICLFMVSCIIDSVKKKRLC